MEKRIAFAALKVPSPRELDLHITIARRYDISESERQAMQYDLERLIRPHLPIRVEFGNFCHLGENGSFPAYKVTIPNVAVWNLIKEYHQRYYREAPDKALFPKLKLHVTVDTPEKREFFETMIRSGQGFFNVTDTLFSTQTKGANPVIDVQQRTWTCPDCQKINSMEIKECQNPHCNQWRPKVSRPGDWNCPQCLYSNFASRAQCAKCNTLKNANPYEIPPPSAPVFRTAPAPNHSNNNSDWWCTVCDFKIFGSKASCGKCGQIRHY